MHMRLVVLLVYKLEENVKLVANYYLVQTLCRITLKMFMKANTNVNLVVYIYLCLSNCQIRYQSDCKLYIRNEITFRLSILLSFVMMERCNAIYY